MLYLSERINSRLEPKLRRELRPGARIVSHQFRIGSWTPLESVRAPDATDLFLWRIPPFDPLLFFGDAGNGDQYGFVILDGVVRQGDVFVWNHENDSRSWVAPSLERYLDWASSGTLPA